MNRGNADERSFPIELLMGAARLGWNAIRRVAGSGSAVQVPQHRYKWSMWQRFSELNRPGASVDPEGIDDPIDLFGFWFEQAKRAEPHVPDAMNVATVTPEGRPRNRMMLLKGADEAGFRFFTNYESDKGRELAANAWASLCLHWKSLERQVRVEGRVERLSDAESDAYWSTRPRGSQLGAWASDQSRPVESKAAMERKVADAARRFGDGPIPRPEHWGGYRVVPVRIEFWQGRHFRVHDRWCFERDDPSRPWRKRRLQP